jgi:leader peptidase (prepilin peptidase)/N-methyltransferase
MVMAAVAGLAIGAILPTATHVLVTRRAATDDRGATSAAPPAAAPDPDPQPASRAGRVTHAALVAIVTAAVWAVLVARLRHDSLLPTAMITAVVAIAAAYVDLRCRRLPNVLVLPGAASCVASVAAAGTFAHDPYRLARTVAGALVVTSALFFLALVVGGLGMGDVKTGMWMSILAGWHSPTALLIAAAGPFVIQGAVTVILVLSGRVTRGQALPFGPALAAAGLASLVLTP